MLLKDLLTDARQMVEEGHNLESLNQEIEAAARKSLDALARLQEDFWARPSPAGFPYQEPSDWDSMASHFPDPAGHAQFTGDEALLRDRIHGGWLGRAVGCQLGKPLEGTARPDKVKRVLEAVGSWPLTDYMNPPPEGLKTETLADCHFFATPNLSNDTRGRFRGMSPDDDIHYAVISQSVLKRFGTEFTSEQAVDMLLELNPYSMLWASGRNLFRTYAFGVPVSHTGVFGNPCRQSLGAMIRCDPWGWGSPGNPLLAARMAYRDAVNSQRRNGIYAGLFFAIVLADTLAHGDPLKAVETATAYLPPRSRFAEMIRYMPNPNGF